MHKQDNHAPATKADIQMLMEQIGMLYDANQRWKSEIMEHFDLTVENIRHDLQGARRDEIESIKDDVQRLKQHAGFAA